MELDNTTSDGCTWIPDVIYGVDISECCKAHDTTNSCSTSKFYKCLASKIDMFTSAAIAGGGALGCWLKYTKYMWKRL